MKFNFASWEEFEQANGLIPFREDETLQNTKVAQRGPRVKKPPKTENSFSHLLGVRFKVKKLALPGYHPADLAFRSYFISETERVKAALKRAEKGKTSLD